MLGEHTMTVNFSYRAISNLTLDLKGVVNCQNSRDKGPPEGNSARG